jgi:hypothetical protein
MAWLRSKRSEPQGNRVLIVRPLSYILDPKPMRAYHGQGEVRRKTNGGPNPYVVQLIGMICDKK